MTSALETLRIKYALLKPALNERAQRLWAATEAMAVGRGGIETVVQATGISRSTVSRGLKELKAGAVVEPARTRRPGGGRKRNVEKDPTLLADLEALVEPATSGAP